MLQGFKANKEGKQVFFDWLCFGKETFTGQQLAQTIETLKNIKFKRFTDNLLRFNVTPGDVDWFEDFSSILSNARLWAQVARETGMKGWMFDVEDYKGSVFDYQKVKFTGKKTFAEYAEQVRLRGRAFMQAVQDAYPDMVLLLALGPSYCLDAEALPGGLAAHPYGLLPAFVTGLLEVVGPRVRLVDGNEKAYGYLTSEDYFRGFHAIQQQAKRFIPSELRARYRARMEAGMAVYVNYALALKGVVKGPPSFLTEKDRLQLFEHNVYYALTTADEYVWCYGERICWWEKGHPIPLPDGAVEAIRSARAKYENNQPLGFDMTERIAAARAKEKQSR